MTVMLRGRRARRQQGRRVNEGTWPPTWTPGHMSGGTLKSDGSATVEPAPGSAKPGRGGRRKRRRRAAGERAARLHAQIWERLGWEALASMRLAWTLLQRADRLIPNPSPYRPGPGRRERRRRAKLRRRRARRAVEARAKRFAPGGNWAALAKNWAFRRVSVEHATGEDLDRLAEMFGMTRLSPTPGV